MLGALFLVIRTGGRHSGLAPERPCIVDDEESLWSSDEIANIDAHAVEAEHDRQQHYVPAHRWRRTIGIVLVDVEHVAGDNHQQTRNMIPEREVSLPRRIGNGCARQAVMPQATHSPIVFR